jgi:hypothetical protein
MEHFFELPVTYKGEELNLKGRLVTFGYTYKFYVVLNGEEYIFERDDEHQYRMLSVENNVNKPIDKELIELVIRALENLAEKQ